MRRASGLGVCVGVVCCDCFVCVVVVEGGCCVCGRVRRGPYTVQRSDDNKPPFTFVGAQQPVDGAEPVCACIEKEGMNQSSKQASQQASNWLLYTRIYTQIYICISMSHPTGCSEYQAGGGSTRTHTLHIYILYIDIRWIHRFKFPPPPTGCSGCRAGGGSAPGARGPPRPRSYSCRATAPVRTWMV